FAFPGKITDKKSEGCNYLIQQNKAILCSSPGGFLQTMGWENSETTRNPVQPDLFVDTSDQEKMILEIIRQRESVHIDELLMEFNFNSSILSSLLLSLEMKNLVSCLPGRKYRLL
ncbi:MAG: DprA-like winged helix domain-containing protein, partial [Flavitalea sp.]